MIKIAVLPGDGIGVEVTKAAIPIFEKLKIPVKLTFGDIGWTFWQNEGNPIPERTWQLIRESDTVLLGATTSKPKREAMAELGVAFQENQPAYISPILQLRQQLDLFANVRPCFNIKKEGSDFHFAVIRENTEGLYAGFDFHPIPRELKTLLAQNPLWKNLDAKEISCSLRLQSKKGLLRLFEFAFRYAEKQNLQRVTLADKPNVLRQSGAFAREIFEEVASRYPAIKADILNVDAVALWLIRRPADFGIIVAENMFGDILSDVGAGIMGGLGLAPSANIGEKGCYFEPVHGSAPKIQENHANPGAMFLTIALLLTHFGYSKEAHLIQEALRKVLQEKKSLTYDLGGRASTEAMAAAILQAVESKGKKDEI